MQLNTCRTEDMSATDLGGLETRRAGDGEKRGEGRGQRQLKAMKGHSTLAYFASDKILSAAQCLRLSRL